MAARIVLGPGHKLKVYKTSIGMTALLMLVIPLSQGSDSPVSSSQQMLKKSVDSGLSARSSELLRDTRTINLNDNPSDTTDNEIIITPSEVIGDSSYINKKIENARENGIRKSDFSELKITKTLTGADEYYDGIKPTKAADIREEKISRTGTGFPGEAGGVSMNQSRPREETEDKSYRKGDELKSRKFFGESSSKYLEKHRLAKNFNQVEKTLGKIAKIALDEKAAVTNRTSREEENRKASPDIQDIITGIVKILNGKTNAQGSTPRPQRPTSTRINNRGPPRISDVPPLDFDAPPSFVPLPPPPPKTVPPPYPFDIPPSMPNIPLPPQPLKPGHSNLPSHPFIDGVPIPEIVVPGKPPAPEYDTISVSIPHTEDNLKFPSLTTGNQLIRNETSLDLIPLQTIPSPTPSVNRNSTVKPDSNKSKPAQKLTSTAVNNKNGNKRIRPRPARPQNGTRILPKPIQMKNVTLILSPHQNASEIHSNVTQDITTKESEKSAENGTTTEESTTPAVTEVFDTESLTNPSNPSSLPENTEIIAVEEFLGPGIGEATPVLESSVPEINPEPILRTTPVLTSTRTVSMETTQEYKVRPGIVLDDPEYKPMGHKIISTRPIITAPPPPSHYGEIFDITVHAIQGPAKEEASTTGKPFIYPVELNGGVLIQKGEVPNAEVSVITKPEQGQDFVSIDGKRTYINLFGESTSRPSPTATQPPTITATGYPVPHKESPILHQNNRHTISTVPPRRPYKRPSHPPVRIDTCIVGDDSTCDSTQNEMCRTEDGVSSCHCRPGYNRRKTRDTCRRVVSMITSLRVDKLYDRKVKWENTLTDPDSEEYQQLSYEAGQAIESAMSMTPFSDDFINSKINSIYSARNLETNEPAVYINVTIQLEENVDTVRPAVKHDIQRHLLRVIERRNNNVGKSAIWVNSLPGSILALQDVDECSSAELHDCHQRAVCFNTFGSFKCQCPEGSRDLWLGNVHRQGRHCEICSSEHCNNRGECRFEQGQQICQCSGSFYGAQCEVDGEVLGVAIGASVAAAIIIILTLVCLCMWSRKWSREQKTAVGAGMGSPVFGYMATGPTVKTPNVGGPPYQVSLEDRIRWAQIADVMAQTNHYAQPEPGNCGNRTSFGGYPTLPAHTAHTMSTKGTLPLSTVTPPVPLPRLSLPNKTSLASYGVFGQHGSIHQKNGGLRTSLDTTSSSEEEDRVDLLGRHFNAPRPKSRTSVANQSGIYYDVDYDRSDIYSKHNTIPMNTYTLNPQHQVRPFFRLRRRRISLERPHHVTVVDSAAHDDEPNRLR